jgi:hypothetical protein
MPLSPNGYGDRLDGLPTTWAMADNSLGQGLKGLRAEATYGMRCNAQRLPGLAQHHILGVLSQISPMLYH